MSYSWNFWNFETNTYFLAIMVHLKYMWLNKKKSANHSLIFSTLEKRLKTRFRHK